MNSILIKVSDLLAKAQELSQDGIEYVELSLLEADGELPACVCFNAYSATDDSCIDYEEINAVDANF